MSDSRPFEKQRKIASWLAEPMPAEVARSIQKLAQAEDVQRVAVMPDVHLGRDVCVGVVVATSQLIYPYAVGGDIGCGMAAIQFNADANLLESERAAAQVFSQLYQRVPSNKHSSALAPKRLPGELQSKPLSDARLEKLKRRDGRFQLGTLGQGNHFLEFQADQEQQLWLMVHSGSRGMGQAITDHHCRLAQPEPGRLPRFDSHSEAGGAYLADAAWAVSYAEWNRLAMIEAVADFMRDMFGVAMDRKSLIHADHNHVRREHHFGNDFWVHRKGAQSAQLEEPGVIPGSMGSRSYHVAGRACPESLCSSSHGAGRKFSRTDARKNISPRQFQSELQDVWYDTRRSDALRDEAPSAYKDIRSVMRAQKKLTRIVRELQPVLCYKGV